MRTIISIARIELLSSSVYLINLEEIERLQKIHCTKFHQRNCCNYQVSLFDFDSLFPLELEISLSSKIPNRGFDRSLSTEKKYFKTAFKTTDTINADPSNSMNVDYGWYASTVSHRTRQMLHTAVTEITRLISPRGSSTRNPSINVVTCESYYRPPFHQLGHPSFLYPSESTTISPLTVEIFRCRPGVVEPGRAVTSTKARVNSVTNLISVPFLRCRFALSFRGSSFASVIVRRTFNSIPKMSIIRSGREKFV